MLWDEDTCPIYNIKQKKAKKASSISSAAQIQLELAPPWAYQGGYSIRASTTFRQTCNRGFSPASTSLGSSSSSDSNLPIELMIIDLQVWIVSGHMARWDALWVHDARRSISSCTWPHYFCFPGDGIGLPNWAYWILPTLRPGRIARPMYAFKNSLPWMKIWKKGRNEQAGKQRIYTMFIVKIFFQSTSESLMKW